MLETILIKLKVSTNSPNNWNKNSKIVIWALVKVEQYGFNLFTQGFCNFMKSLVSQEKGFQASR